MFTRPQKSSEPYPIKSARKYSIAESLFNENQQMQSEIKHFMIGIVAGISIKEGTGFDVHNQSIDLSFPAEGNHLVASVDPFYQVFVYLPNELFAGFNAHEYQKVMMKSIFEQLYFYFKCCNPVMANSRRLSFEEKLSPPSP